MLQAGVYFSSAVSLYQYSGSSCVYIYILFIQSMIPASPPAYRNDSEDAKSRFFKFNNMENVMQENICA